MSLAPYAVRAVLAAEEQRKRFQSWIKYDFEDWAAKWILWPFLSIVWSQAAAYLSYVAWSIGHIMFGDSSTQYPVLFWHVVRLGGFYFLVYMELRYLWRKVPLWWNELVSWAHRPEHIAKQLES